MFLVSVIIYSAGTAIKLLFWKNAQKWYFLVQFLKIAIETTVFPQINQAVWLSFWKWKVETVAILFMLLDCLSRLLRYINLLLTYLLPGILWLNRCPLLHTELSYVWYETLHHDANDKTHSLVLNHLLSYFLYNTSPLILSTGHKNDK